MSTPKRFHRVREVLDRRQPDLTVLMEDVQIPRNFAALLRTCDAVGVLEAHAVWRIGGQLKISRPASGGTRKWVPVRRYRDLESAAATLKGRGFRILAAHPADRAVDYREVDYTLPTAVLLGQEETGVTPQAVEMADDLVVIPMMGMGLSLNVSVAAALILFEARRQRAAAGLYDQRRLDPELYERLLFEWTYPVLARLCQKKKVAYPRLGPEGEILGELPR
ncbi:MAG TPA: tRNA (guanosine(18)-2'-O)-methyltransferase TrmH [Thermoanaerobaculia bacterium]|jgi:tRNA (guanosine-2'-O-)-methyltransferase|nr:tRNA (guanosine(18)-2'-O)-methyltransferase TrmH [Thermoanaerobaculia bacterium]